MSFTNTDIIIIKGAPASGKSQTAKELSKYFPEGVRMEVDKLRSFVISVDWTNQIEHFKILNLSANLALEFINLGFKPIIIIDTFSGDKLNSYYEKLKTLNTSWLIRPFGLYTTEQELKNRLEKRSRDQFINFTITKKLNEDTLKYRHDKEYQIDTTNLESKETAKIIYEEVMKINTSSRQ